MRLCLLFAFHVLTTHLNLRKIKGEQKAKVPVPPVFRLRGIKYFMQAAALRAQIESAVERRFPSPFRYFPDKRVETVPTLIAELDAAAGGLPRGGFVEICGPSSSGRTGLLISMLASIARQGEVCALVDGSDALDPNSLDQAGINLACLLWVRCREIQQALRSTDLLLQGGGFGMLALDLAGFQSHMVRRIPLSTWFRFRRAVENTRTVFAVLEHEPSAQSCSSLTLQMEPEIIRWIRTGVGGAPEPGTDVVASCPAGPAPAAERRGYGKDTSWSTPGCEAEAWRGVPSHSVLLGGVRLNVYISRFRKFLPSRISLSTRVGLR